MMDNAPFVIGLDYGTDSVRAVLVNANNGDCVASKVFLYPRWKEQKFCNAAANQFRQHPADHLEGLEETIKSIVNSSGIDPVQVKGICVDTTGSSPLPVDQEGKALVFIPGFEENPNAMMVLWKDHTAIPEAEEINELARSWGGEDFTKYEGGIYSSEWFWAKILHIIREDEKVAEAAFSWVEHCDYITAVLTGETDPLSLKRSRCAAGHKAMWHEKWDGLPSKEFLKLLDPRLASLRDRLYKNTYTSDQPAGKISKEWAEKLGLSEEVVIAVGIFDAHAGAVGGEISEHTLIKVMGTSTCDIMVASKENFGDNLVKGICGQVDGSVIPGMIGLEAGQSGFGDVLAWFKNVLAWPVHHLVQNTSILDKATKEALINELEEKMMVELSEAAEKIPVTEKDAVALDWVNGRRTPDANQALKGALMGLTMGAEASHIFKAFVESICFGSKKIVDRFEQEGVEIKAVIGMGGVAKKSRFVMQSMADILNMPIKVATSEQAPALGAAMFAAVASGIYKNTHEAIKAMSNGFDTTYYPQEKKAAVYQKLYEKYSKLGDFVEKVSK
ncbi:ribulokinase [soil metagenome]